MENQLKNHGFKEISPTAYDSQSVKKRYQLAIKDNKGIKYFINAKYYEIPDAPPSYSFEIHTTVGTGEDVHAIIEHAKSVPNVELYAERIWQAVGKNYYSITEKQERE